MRITYLLSIWLHILAAMFWIGGMMFLVFVVLPVVRKPGSGLNAMEVIRATGSRFRATSWAALLLLVVTGLFNLYYRGALSSAAGSAYWGSVLGQVMVWKLSIVTLVFILSAVHDFYIGPNARKAWEKDPRSRQAAVGRILASWMGRITMLLAMVIVALAIMFVRGLPW